MVQNKAYFRRVQPWRQIKFQQHNVAQNAIVFRDMHLHLADY